MRKGKMTNEQKESENKRHRLLKNVGEATNRPNVLGERREKTNGTEELWIEEKCKRYDDIFIRNEGIVFFP